MVSRYDIQFNLFLSFTVAVFGVNILSQSFVCPYIYIFAIVFLNHLLCAKKSFRFSFSLVPFVVSSRWKLYDGISTLIDSSMVIFSLNSYLLRDGYIHEWTEKWNVHEFTTKLFCDGNRGSSDWVNRSAMNWSHENLT